MPAGEAAAGFSASMATAPSQFFHAHPGKNSQRERRADAGGGNEQFEKILFARGDKTEERQGIFAHVRVNEKSDLGVQLAERSVGRERHLHEITNAAHVDEHLVRPFSSEASAKLTNHRQSVLPPFLRLSTQSGVAGVA